MTPQRRKDHATQYAKKVDPARIAGDTLPLGMKKPDLAAGLFLDWQPRKDSNLRMPESESGALPLGDGAVGRRELYSRRRVNASRPERNQAENAWFALAASRNAPQEDTRFGVFRM